MSLEVHVVHVTAILKVHVVESVIQLQASVAASPASQAERVMNVGHDLPLLTVSADVREKLFDAMLSVPDVRVC